VRRGIKAWLDFVEILSLHLGILKRDLRVANGYVKRLALVDHRIDESMAHELWVFSAGGGIRTHEPFPVELLDTKGRGPEQRGERSRSRR